MKELIKKNFNKIIIYFIILQPLFDLITAIAINSFNLNITIGIIIRMAFLIFIVSTVIFVYNKKKALLYYFPLLIYFLIFLSDVLINKNGNNLFGELQGLLRTFYFPILLFSFYVIKDELKIGINTLIKAVLIYLLLIFFPMILNIGFNSYDIAKTGTVGFFNSANEIGAIISIITPFLFLIIKDKKYLKNVLIFLCYIIVILNIGTKTPILSFSITFFLILLWIIIKYIKERRYKAIIVSFISLLLIFISIVIFLPKTAFYKNIKIHMDYLEVKSITEIFKEPKLIDHFIFSERLTFLDNKYKIYEQAPIYEKLVGIGYYNGEKEIKMIEMDYFDIYYSHGLLGFILFFSIYIYILINTFKNKGKINFIKYIQLISVFLIILLSLFTGHIITAPSVSLFVVIIIFINDKQISSVSNLKNKNKFLE